VSASARALLERIAPAVPHAGEAEVPRRLIWALAVGVAGLTWSMTTVVTYLPHVLASFTSSRSVIGAILAAEGAVAVTVPLVVGPLSDRVWTRLGRRRPFMLAALPAMAATLVFLTLVGGLLATALVLGGFFIAYYVYATPYRSLYPDRLPRQVEGRAQSVQHLVRGAAIGCALVLGGLLLGIWQGLPFVVAAGVVVVSGVAALVLIDEPEKSRRRSAHSFAQPWQVVRRSREVRLFLIANTAWELTFAGMRTFVVLYIVQGLKQPLYVSSAVLGTVAAGYMVAAVGAGRIGDRIGTGRVIAAASLVYGCGLFVGLFPSHWHWLFLGFVFVVAIAAGAVMTLAWSLLYKVMPNRDRGATAGLASMTKGLGLMIGPAAVGVAIDLCKGILSSTRGYAIMWPLLAVPILAALPLVLALSRVEQRRPAAAR
jgi:MFS family permease